MNFILFYLRSKQEKSNMSQWESEIGRRLNRELREEKDTTFNNVYVLFIFFLWIGKEREGKNGETVSRYDLEYYDSLWTQNIRLQIQIVSHKIRRTRIFNFSWCFDTFSFTFNFQPSIPLFEFPGCSFVPSSPQFVF